MSEVNRFFIAERYADNGELSHRALVDAADGRELGTDGGEPEDQSFWRDWAWVPDEMNKLGNEIVTIRDERDRLRRLIEPLLKMTPERPNAITWENGVQIINYVQDILKAALTPGEGGQDE